MKTADICTAEDKLLLLKMREGSTDAFDALYERYWDLVYSSAFKRMKDADGAKDVTQNVFLQLWARRAEVHIDNLSAYLYVAVRNNVYKWMEKEERYTPIPDLLLQLETVADQADAELIRKEFFKAWEVLVASLTPSQQEIFRMRYNEDMSTDEIAQKLNISRKTVQNQLGRSVAFLRHSLSLICLLLSLTR